MSRHGIALVTAFLLAGCGSDGPRSPIVGHAVFAGYDDHRSIQISLSHGSATAETDRFGYFALPEVPAGDYYVIASHAATLERHVSVSVRHDGRVARRADLILTPVGRIEGTIHNTGGQPLVGATLEVAGSDAGTVSVEGGRFVIDPSPVGDVVLLGSASTYAASQTELRVEVGGSAAADLTLAPSTRPDPYAGNRPPTVSQVRLVAQPDDHYPQVVPLVDTSGGRVRRRGWYELSVDASDPDGDSLRVFWSADRGTLETVIGERVRWRAGGGQSTLTATAVDPFGASATVRTVVSATADNLRGGGRHGDRIYYAERRADTYDLYSYTPATAEETLIRGGDLQQHAVTVSGDWLVWGDSEFVFVGSLVYRLRALNLADGRNLEFGQPFDHDSIFEIYFDLYTPLYGGFVPFRASNDTIAPEGLGYLDLESGDAVRPSPFPTDTTGPANQRGVARQGNLEAWLSADGGVRLRARPGPVQLVATLPVPAPWPLDLQLHEGVVAALPAKGGPVYWLDTADNGSVNVLGSAVTSFALFARQIVYVEQGPTSAAVLLTDLDTGQVQSLSTEPHFSRRIWFFDGEVVLWGDQGAVGQAFVELDTELLWVYRL